jgi:hypothetical protein
MIYNFYVVIFLCWGLRRILDIWFRLKQHNSVTKSIAVIAFNFNSVTKFIAVIAFSFNSVTKFIAVIAFSF